MEIAQESRKFPNSSENNICKRFLSKTTSLGYVS